MNCKQLILKEFDYKIIDGMVTAPLIHQRRAFRKYQLSTIRTTMSNLRTAGELEISVRRPGKMSKQLDFEGRPKYITGVCYYRVRK